MLNESEQFRKYYVFLKGTKRPYQCLEPSVEKAMESAAKAHPTKKIIYIKEFK